MLTITNTITNSKELFVPQKSDQVSMYVCGITPYDLAHIGHGRVYVTFDVLYRLLKLSGYSVAYCRNFTDIDDKLINRAVKEFGKESRYADIAKRYIDQYHENMRALNCLPPTYEPRVTDCIKDIIKFVEQLIAAQKAYVIDGDVYFSIDAHPHYGILSKHKLEDLRAGARVEPNDKKRNPLDFALWKSEKPNTFFESPWGWGRPGWHIECSAMALAYLGSSIDIHGGGLDLVFPHHENEIAQSEALLGKPFVHYWMHNGFVRINQEKMSKSLGNFFTLNDVFKQFDPMIIRFYYVSHHYKAPMDFAIDDIKAVEKSYRKLCRIFKEIDPVQSPNNEPITASLVDRLNDDLNTPAFFGTLFSYLNDNQPDPSILSYIKKLLIDTVGLTLQPLPEITVELTPEIEELLHARAQARQQKDWKRADALRDQLIALGYQVQDKKS